MVFSADFIQQLRWQILQSLPGIDAQMQMAPPVRTRFPTIPHNVKHGGVCILLFEEDSVWKILLMIRTDDGGAHSGQISFPGGSYDTEDFSITHTAMRELSEEMGIDVDEIEILGSLTELYIPPSNFLIYPLVATCKSKLCLNPNEIEVKQILKTPIHTFLNSQNIVQKQVQRSDNSSIKINVPAYLIENDNFIWGATAMVLAEFLEIVKKISA